MSKPITYPDKSLSRFKELGVTGNIKAKVISMDEKFRTNDTAKGKAGSFYKTAIILKDNTGTIGFDRWIPISELPFKLNDLISINEVHSVHDDYNDTWQIKSCSKSEVTIHTDESEFIAEAEKIADEHVVVAIGSPLTSKSIGTVELGTYSKEKGAGTITVDMPFNPKAIESEFEYYPEWDIPTLRKKHAKEPQGIIRGHIENLIEGKKLQDMVSELIRVFHLLLKLLEGMKK